MPRDVMPRDVVAYYEAKTASILGKYGPGPRVHYHSGLVPARPAEPDSSKAMHAAQELLLAQIATLWPNGYLRDKRILDVGCGLGGGALFWAAEHRARVTAVTNVPGHVGIVRSFAEAAGVSERVRVVLRDAHQPTDEPADIVIAIESSSYFDRFAWFRSLNALHGGLDHALVVVVDCFTAHEETARLFDAYWRTRVGTEEEYVAAASSCGFRLLQHVRLNELVAPFWDLSVAHSRACLERSEDNAERERLRRSIRAHIWLRNALERHAITYTLSVFGRDEPA